MMKVNDLEFYFEHEKNPKFFLVDAYSWRGSYDEPCFTPSLEGTKEESLELINKIYTETFGGWKGGEFCFNVDDDIHFESSDGEWSDTEPEEFLYKNLGIKFDFDLWRESYDKQVEIINRACEWVENNMAHFWHMDDESVSDKLRRALEGGKK